MIKRLFLALLMAAAVFSTASCTLMDVLSHYEEHISLTEEEQAVYLKGKWKLNKVGYEYSDDYGVNQVSEDEYQEGSPPFER